MPTTSTESPSASSGSMKRPGRRPLPVTAKFVQKRYVPELCSGCDKCLPACPVNCIYPFPEWESAGYPAEWWAEPLSDDDPYT